MVDKVEMFPLALLLLAIHCASGKDYLAILAYKTSGTSVTAKAGETGSLVELRYPQFGYRTSHPLASGRSVSINIDGKMKVMGSIEPKVIIISTSDADMQITLNGESRFNPLPISALGTKYIVPSDMTYTEDYEKLLVVATHNQSADVDISFRIKEGAEYINGHIFRSGERITLGLRPYQTLTIITKNDINGTVISARGSIAVYTGIIYNNTHTAYDQLLPVKHYGQEFVVAVETTGRNSQLQVITEQNDTQIRFSDGAEVSLGENRFYQRPLNRSLHISATRPVMVTLIRRDGVKSVFATVPPVNTYLPANYTIGYEQWRRPNLKICTRKTATLVIQTRYAHQQGTVDWEEISGSGYKVGTVTWEYWSGYTASLSCDHPFTLLTYHNGSNAYHYYLYSLSLEEAPARPFRGRTYLMALPRFRRVSLDLPYLPGIHASTGQDGGQWQIQNPYTGKIWSRQVPPLNTDYFYPQYSINTANGIQNKTILVHVENDDIQIGGHANTTVFSPLPISALGTKYILSFCHPSWIYISVIVIATHSKKTNVDITWMVSLDDYITYDNKQYFHGDTLSLTLMEYQAFTLNSTSDLTGTVVAAEETIAVYSATYEGVHAAACNHLIAYQQLLPIRHHGKEYVVAVRDQPISSPPYQVQVVTDHNDTQIMFNDGSTVSVGDTGVFRKRYGPLTNLYFNTTQPVMTTLCLLSYDRYGTFTIVPPVAYYSKQSAITSGGTLQIITDKGNNNVNVEGHFTSQEYLDRYRSQGYYNHDTSIEFNIHVDWTPIKGSRYKVGTCRASDGIVSYLMTDFFVFVHSNTPFSILAYRPVSTYRRRLFHLVVDNGGFSFKSYKLNNETKDFSVTKPKNNGTTPFQGSQCNDNAVVIVGVCFGLVIVSLVIGFTGYVLYVRRKMKSTEEFSSVNVSVSQAKTTFI